MDKIFGASQYLLEYEKAVAKHIDRQASDTKPELGRKKRRFCFDRRWIDKPGIEDTITNACGPECIEWPMFGVTSKVKKMKNGSSLLKESEPYQCSKKDK